MALSNDSVHIEFTASAAGVTDVVGDVGQATDKAVDSVKGLAGAVNDAVRDIQKPLKVTWAQDLSAAAADAGKAVEAGFSVVLKSLTASAAAIGGALGAVAKSALNVGGGFETQMTRVKVISGATAEDLALLTEKARQMGESLPITAQDAASAMELLAQRGTEAKDIIASVADVSALAISQNVSMAEASDLLGATMTNFGIAIEKASEVTDIFNNASNQSALNMSKLTEGLKYVGPAASAAGMKLEEAVAAMEVLANAGLTGEMIGTGLSMTLSKIAASTDILGVKTQELDGTMRPLKDIFAELQERGMTLSEASQEFGERAAKAALNLAKYSGALKENEQGLQEWGSTQRAVTEQLGTFENLFKGLESAAEGVRLEIFDQIKEESKGAVGSMTELTRAFREWIGETGVASKALQGFLSGMGVKIPSGEEFKRMLSAFDAEEFAARVKGFGATLKEIGAGFASLLSTVQGPIAFLLKNIDTFAKLSFWGWILGKGLQVPKALADIGSAFGGLARHTGAVSSLFALLSTPMKATMFTSAADACRAFLTQAQALLAFRWASITTSLQGIGAAMAAAFSTGGIKAVAVALGNLAAGPLATVAAAVAGVSAAMKVAEKYTTAQKELAKAQDREAAVSADLAATESAVKALEWLKTGYEDIGAILDTLPEKQKAWLTAGQNRKQNATVEAFKAAMAEYNASLDETRQHLAASEADVEHWGERMAAACGGNAKAMAALPPQMQEIVRIYGTMGDAAEEQGTAAEGAAKRQVKSVRESLAEMQSAAETTRAGVLQAFSGGISEAVGGALSDIPKKLAEAAESLGGVGVDLAVNVQLDAAQEQLEQFTKDTAEKLSIPEGIVKVGVFNELERLGKAGNSAAQALADGMGMAEKRVDGFLENARDAIEYLGASPSSFMPALTAMANGLNKVNVVTGKVPEAFKKAQTALKEFASMTFDALKSRIQKIKDAVAGGFIDKKALEDEFKGAFEKAQLKINAELTPQKSEYQDPKVFSAVLMSEIRKEMDSIGGKDYGMKAEAELKAMADRFGGDLSRAIEELSRRMQTSAQTQQTAAQQQTQQQKGADSTGMAAALSGVFTPFAAKLETIQAGQAAATQGLTSALTPVTSVVQSLIGRMGAMQNAVAANTTALAGVVGALAKLPQGTTQEAKTNEINIEINQTGFSIQKKADADVVARLTADALRAGLGNAM